MPYIRCPHCGVRSYSAVPWSSPARCSNCGATLDVPIQDPVELEVRRLLYPGPSSVERVYRDRLPGGRRRPPSA
jgi:DNA-directed RNA polymerase subunit RPC12/RpoP